MTNSKPLVDFTFGLSNQAWVVLYALRNTQVDHTLDVTTAPLYNGREAGFVVTLYRTAQNALHIFFAECRSSDSLFVWVSRASASINPPTIKDFREQSYQERKEFDSYAINEVVDYIENLINEEFPTP